MQIGLAQGSDYSDTLYDIKKNTSADGRLIYIPNDAIFEVKYFDVDIVGAIK